MKISGNIILNLTDEDVETMLLSIHYQMENMLNAETSARYDAYSQLYINGRVYLTDSNVIVYESRLFGINNVTCDEERNGIFVDTEGEGIIIKTKVPLEHFIVSPFAASKFMFIDIINQLKQNKWFFEYLVSQEEINKNLMPEKWWED